MPVAGSILVSDEFVALCHTQLRLLVQTLGAASSVVYVTPVVPQADETELVPIACYPVLPLDQLQPAARIEALLESGAADLPRRSLAPSPGFTPVSAPAPVDPAARPGAPAEPVSPIPNSLEQNRAVLPLVHQEVIIGVLVAARPHQPWQPQDHQQLQAIASTISLARVLDRQGQWMRQMVAGQQELEERRQELAHDLLHQFRNPLTALRTYGKLLLKRFQAEDAPTVPTRGDNATAAQVIVQESDRLQGLLEQFRQVIDPQPQPPVPLALAPAATPAVEGTDAALAEPDPAPPPVLPAGLGRVLELAPLQVEAVVLPLLTAMTAIAQEKAIEIHYQATAAAPAVWADQPALTEVLNNLIENAVKYAPRSAHIYIETGLMRRATTAELHRSQAERGADLDETATVPVTMVYGGVLIADTGPGIPPVDIPHIFERHYRGVQAQTDTPGTGLGLAIARSLIEAMRGAIEVFSPLVDCPWIVEQPEWDHLEQGTAFVVWLPTVASTPEVPRSESGAGG